MADGCPSSALDKWLDNLHKYRPQTLSEATHTPPYALVQSFFTVQKLRSARHDAARAMAARREEEEEKKKE